MNQRGNKGEYKGDYAANQIPDFMHMVGGAITTSHIADLVPELDIHDILLNVL